MVNKSKKETECINLIENLVKTYAKNNPDKIVDFYRDYKVPGSKYTFDGAMVVDAGLGDTIFFEYDGTIWHYFEDDIKKDEWCVENGYKIVRIQSGSLLPDSVHLLQIIRIITGTYKGNVWHIPLADFDAELYYTPKSKRNMPKFKKDTPKKGVLYDDEDCPPGSFCGLYLRVHH